MYSAHIQKKFLCVVIAVDAALKYLGPFLSLLQKMVICFLSFSVFFFLVSEVKKTFPSLVHCAEPFHDAYIVPNMRCIHCGIVCSKYCAHCTHFKTIQITNSSKATRLFLFSIHSHEKKLCSAVPECVRTYVNNTYKYTEWIIYEKNAKETPEYHQKYMCDDKSNNNSNQKKNEEDTHWAIKQE